MVVLYYKHFWEASPSVSDVDYVKGNLLPSLKD